MPGDLGDLAIAKGARVPTFTPPTQWSAAPAAQVDAAVTALGEAAKVTLLVAPQTIEGAFAQGAREMIVVLPDSKTRHNGSMYSSSVTTGDF